jgi:hypothetical protein
MSRGQTPVRSLPTDTDIPSRRDAHCDRLTYQGGAEVGLAPTETRLQAVFGLSPIEKGTVGTKIIPITSQNHSEVQTLWARLEAGGGLAFNQSRFTS